MQLSLIFVLHTEKAQAIVLNAIYKKSSSKFDFENYKFKYTEAVNSFLLTKTCKGQKGYIHTYTYIYIYYLNIFNEYDRFEYDKIYMSFISSNRLKGAVFLFDFMLQFSLITINKQIW